MGAREELGREIEETDVTERDLEVLKSFDDSEDSTFAFQGLKRKLGFHSETLSRSLKRLERDALLKRTADGYSLTGRGQLLISSRRAQPPLRTLHIFQAYLPSGELLALEHRLRYRWFGGLRWLGSFTRDGRTVMSWITDDGSSQVNVTVNGRIVSVDAAAEDGASREKAIRSAYALVSQIAKAYSSQGGIHALLLSHYSAS